MGDLISEPRKWCVTRNVNKDKRASFYLANIFIPLGGVESSTIWEICPKVFIPQV